MLYADDHRVIIMSFGFHIITVGKCDVNPCLPSFTHKEDMRYYICINHLSYVISSEGDGASSTCKTPSYSDCIKTFSFIIHPHEEDRRNESERGVTQVSFTGGPRCVPLYW